MGGRQAVFACFVASAAFLSMLFEVVTANGWPTREILSSVARISVVIDGESGNCTAFSVDQAAGRFITAAHCAAGTVRLGSSLLFLVATDKDGDLALLESREVGLPALRLGSQPKEGDSTLSVGYPTNSPKPMMVPSLYQGQFDAWADGGNHAVFSGNSMPGMSGGPIVNTRGEVVSVILGGGNPAQIFQNVGFGAKHQSLKRLIVRWREDGGG